MKGLTLRQPWASLIAIGAKRVETRSWFTAYRGLLLITASARITADELDTATEEIFSEALSGSGCNGKLPLGQAVACCRLIRCVSTEAIRDTLSPQERAFGDYYEGRYAWVLDDIRRIEPFIPTTGRLGLWAISEDLQVAVRAAMTAGEGAG